MDGRFIIDNLLRQEKNERLGFLPKATEDMLAKTITAMLNNRGGDIVIGVDDNKRILGVSEGDMSGLSKALANRIRPSAPIDIHSIDYNGTDILLISVWEGTQKPYHCDGKIYQKKRKTRTPKGVFVTFGSPCLCVKPYCLPAMML